MSTTTPSRAPEVPPVRLHRLVEVELRKMVDTRAGRGLVIATAAAVLVVAGLALLIGYLSQTLMALATVLNAVTIPMTLLLPVIAILSITSEWGSRTHMVTFTLEPRRGRVMAAKLLAVLVLTLSALVVGLALTAAVYLVYDLTGLGAVEWTLGGGDLIGYAASLLLASLTAFGLGALLLSAAPAILVYVALVYVLPTAVSLASLFLPELNQAQPWFNLLVSQGVLSSGSTDPTAWAQLATSVLLWVGLPLGLGLWRVSRADVS